MLNYLIILLSLTINIMMLYSWEAEVALDDVTLNETHPKLPSGINE